MGEEKLLPKTNRQRLDSIEKQLQSLNFDVERVLKPQIAEIKSLLSENVFATHAEYMTLKEENKALKQAIVTIQNETKNYKLVERSVFGIIGMMVSSIVVALIYLVVTVKR